MASPMKSHRPIFLDSHSTTPLDPRVLEAMMPYLTHAFGNASSIHHAYGTEAREAVDRAREQVAALIGAQPDEIVFTSGATESNNLALRGAAETRRTRAPHLISCVTEHPAVLDPIKRLERDGHPVTLLGVDRGGHIALEALARAIMPATGIVSLMHANNETGVLHDLAAVADIVTPSGAWLHTDASQSAGKVPIDVAALGIHLLSLSGHKMYGPKGVGALYVRRRDPRVRLAALIDGGGHENGMRSGTLNVAGIVGLGAACEIAAAEMDNDARRLAGLRDRLRAQVLAGIVGAEENGDTHRRLPHSLNVTIPFVESNTLLQEMTTVAASAGSACSSAQPHPSHVLMAMFGDEDRARSSVRFGLTRLTTGEEIDQAAHDMVGMVRALRQRSGLYGEATGSGRGAPNT